MKRIFFFPLVLLITYHDRRAEGLPPPPKKVTTFVTYAYEQGDEPIQVPVPSGSFNTPDELSADPSHTQPQIETHPPQQHQQPDLARDLQPPREASAGVLPPPILQGPIPIPVEHPSPVGIHSPPVVKFEDINIIQENDSGNQVVETPNSKIFPAKTQSFQIIKAPMIQEHSVTNDGDFMKALAHAFGVTNRFVLNSQLENAASVLGAPDSDTVTTFRPPISITQPTETQQEVPPVIQFQHPPQQQTQLQKQQSLQAALIQSLQHLSAPQQLQSQQSQQSQDNGVFQILSHASSSSLEDPRNALQSPNPPPPQYQYTLHVADGDRKLSGPEGVVGVGAPKEVVIQEEVKAPSGRLEQGYYNTEVVQVVSPPPLVQQVTQPSPSQLPLFVPQAQPQPLAIRKFRPITPSRQIAETPSVQIANSAEAPPPIVTPIKFSDSTTVSKTTFTRFRPQVLLFRNHNENNLETTPQNNPPQFQPSQPNNQYIQENPANQQTIQEDRSNQQYIQQTPVVQQNIPQNPIIQQHIQDNTQNQQHIQGNPPQELYNQENIHANNFQDSNSQQIFRPSPVNALSSSEVQDPNIEQYERQINGYLTTGTTGESSNESQTESQEIQDGEGKYAVFEPQKVVHGVNNAGELVEIAPYRNQYRRRRPNGRRLKVRRKKVKVRRLAPVSVQV